MKILLIVGIVVVVAVAGVLAYAATQPDEFRVARSFLGKVMHVFFNMDRMVGDDFAAGLAQLKARAEA